MTPYEEYQARLEKEESEDKAQLTELQRKQDEEFLNKAYSMTYLNLLQIMNLEDSAHGKRTKRLIHDHAVREYHREEASCGLL